MATAASVAPLACMLGFTAQTAVDVPSLLAAFYLPPCAFFPPQLSSLFYPLMLSVSYGFFFFF